MMWKSSFALLTLASAVDLLDLQRAHQKQPGDRVVSLNGHVGMTVKLNAALRAMKDANVKPCDDFTVSDLISLQRKLYEARDPALEAIYVASNDNGRRLAAFGQHTSDLKQLEQLWAHEMEALQVYPKLISVSRDTKCHEAVMWFVHHIPQRMQTKLRKDLILPLLPEREQTEVSEVAQEAFKKVSGPPGGLGCSSAHAKSSTAHNTKYKQWPEELTYSATGHGAFPFWDNGGPGCSHCDPSVSNSAELKVMYSDKLRTELLMHASCGDMTWTGSSKAPKKSPCNHIFTPDDGGFIYTPKTALEPEADGEFCCRSVAKGSKTFTGAVPRDWMKSMTYAGTYANFKGDHYSGPIEMFTSGSPLSFWYYTQPDGTPVQQGEGCYQPGGKKPQACQSMMPIVLYHDWDPAQWKNATFTKSDFVVPDVCKSTKYSCSIPGDNAQMIVV